MRARQNERYAQGSGTFELSITATGFLDAMISGHEKSGQPAVAKWRGKRKNRHYVARDAIGLDMVSTSTTGGTLK